MRRDRLGKVVVAALVVLILAVSGYAWTDAGREPLRTIAVPVDVPALGPELPR